MNTLMIVLMSILGVALFVTVARIIDVLMRWYFAMNKHIELLAGVKTQLQEIKNKQAQIEAAAEKQNNGNKKEKQVIPLLNRAETKAALENSLAALQKLESPPKIWPSIDMEFGSTRLWFPQDGN